MGDVVEIREHVDRLIDAFERLRADPSKERRWESFEFGLHVLKDMLDRWEPILVHGPKVTDAMREEIVNWTGNISELSRRLGVSRQTIHKIRRQAKK